MVFKIVGKSNMVKVCDMNKKCFSKTPLTKKRAIAQRVAIALSESKKSGEPPSHYFA